MDDFKIKPVRFFYGLLKWINYIFNNP
jgi:hypothetical protein